MKIMGPNDSGKSRFRVTSQEVICRKDNKFSSPHDWDSPFVKSLVGKRFIAMAQVMDKQGNHKDGWWVRIKRKPLTLVSLPSSMLKLLHPTISMKTVSDGIIYGLKREDICSSIFQQWPGSFAKTEQTFLKELLKRLT